MGNEILIVAGPTASGKSALALDVAGEFPGILINADSMQVYAELRVLTARPAPADEARVPHRLFGVLPASKPCSAGLWLEMAVAEIESARQAGRLPIVVGGTGLYLKALIGGLAPVPSIPEAVRAEARALHERLGGAAFINELAKWDAGAAARIPPGDGQRLVRAYEVVRATGITLGEWRRQQAPGPSVAGSFAAIVLNPPRDVLYQAIDARLEAMVAAGALDEAAALKGLGLDPGLPAMKALGLPELAAHLDGQMGFHEAVEKAKRASRNFAKRQLTWLRHQSARPGGGAWLDGGEGVEVISAQYSESLKPKIFSFIRRFLLTGHP